eukprot:GHRR01014119.1.p2 GENE.GHRR01014119.1~~GHRR01014119.1.p2  ORF type:complete len:140 (+),score=37.65 GHRR01014119.1:305-724(+)
MPGTVCVGDRLASSDQYTPGPGTYTRGGFIYASIVGSQQITGEGTKQVIKVVGKQAAPVIPEPGSTVIAKITKVAPTAANARIVCCGQQALEADFTGVIRQQDVRAHEKDKVVLHKTINTYTHVVNAMVCMLCDMPQSV